VTVKTRVEKLETHVEKENERMIAAIEKAGLSLSLEQLGAIMDAENEEEADRLLRSYLIPLVDGLTSENYQQFITLYDEKMFGDMTPAEREKLAADAREIREAARGTS